MSFSPLTLVTTLVGGLILAGLLGWIRRPRLVVLVFRQFSYSQLSDRGHLLELSILNRGFKTEEAVELTLNNALRYDLLGANSQDVAVTKNKIAIPRIGPSDDVTVLLLVEGGTFKKDDIVQCLSKETKGQVVAKLEEVPITGPQRVGLIGFAVVIPAFLYGLTTGIDYFYKAVNPAPTEAKGVKESESFEISGWKVPSFYKTTSPQLWEAFSTGKLLATVGTATRKGELVGVPVSLTNHTDMVLEVSITMNSAYSRQKLKSYELSVDRVLLAPGKTIEQSIRVVIPENGTIAERTAYIDVRLQSMTGASLGFQKQHEVQ